MSKTKKKAPVNKKHVALLICLILLVQIFQSVGSHLATACDKRLKNRS
jgi:ABC-type methionine transport system permease subunit